MKGIAVGWSNTVSEPAFGASSGGDASIKSKLINLMTSVRTLMRSMTPDPMEPERWKERVGANESSTTDCDKFDTDCL